MHILIGLVFDAPVVPQGLIGYAYLFCRETLEDCRFRYEVIMLSPFDWLTEFDMKYFPYLSSVFYIDTQR